MKTIAPRLLTSLLLILALFMSYKSNIFLNLLFIFFCLLSLYEYYNLICKIKKFYNIRIALVFFGFSYIISTLFFLAFNVSEFKNIIFYFILVCISSDIGGIVFGKLFKGKKLTKISPNKTYSGFFGAFILSFITMLLFLNYIMLNIFLMIILTFSLCLLSQLGDLLISYFKRLAKVKDTGNILPGHGGVLDRIDGIIISVPINFIFYLISL